jgi:hypothetical protein
VGLCRGSRVWYISILMVFWGTANQTSLQREFLQCTDDPVLKLRLEQVGRIEMHLPLGKNLVNDLFAFYLASGFRTLEYQGS